MNTHAYQEVGRNTLIIDFNEFDDLDLQRLPAAVEAIEEDIPTVSIAYTIEADPNQGDLTFRCHPDRWDQLIGAVNWELGLNIDARTGKVTA